MNFNLELVILVGSVLAALFCGWLVWRYIVVPGAVDDVENPLDEVDVDGL